MERAGVPEVVGNRERIRRIDSARQKGTRGVGPKDRSRRLVVLVGADRRTAGRRQLQRRAVLGESYAAGVLPCDKQLRKRNDQQKGTLGLLQLRSWSGYRQNK